jgi:hypothetical protein
MNARLKRAILLIIAWVAASAALVAALVGINVLLNLFDWSPHWDWRLALSALGILASTVAIWFLARATHDRCTRIASFVLCLTLIVCAFSVLPPEHIDPPPEGGGFLAGLFLRHSPSPIWFRGGICSFMAMPAGFWVVWLLRNRRTDGKYPCS